ncbi:protein-glutamine glutaminase [Chitinophaga sp. HK235]|uniref:protein-glutamine glutaminase n=1 Tax=Chitinophaga sp. HK235 TaxID=2952571 RepID=UPI001BAAB0D7|nr:protein-glutamine glutaminase [Chitinophaga sp. HK235]
MKKTLLGLLVVVSLAVVSIVACKKGADEPVANVKSEKPVLLGEFTPYRLDVTGNKATIGFVQSARLFSLDTRQHQDVLTLLSAARDNDEPIKVNIYEGTNEIAGVEKASRPAIEAYQASKTTKQVVRSENMPIIPNLATLNNLFNLCKTPTIPYSYAADGCYARAHKMRQILIAQGYDCDKLFVYGNLAANTGSCCVYWGYHVAPLVRFRDAAGVVQLRILDPSLFTGPVDQNTWLNKCRDTYCDAGAIISGTSQQPGNVYVRVSNGTLIYDDNYAKTNCTISAYTGLYGCSPTGNNSACW